MGTSWSDFSNSLSRRAKIRIVEALVISLVMTLVSTMGVVDLTVSVFAEPDQPMQSENFTIAQDMNLTGNSTIIPISSLEIPAISSGPTMLDDGSSGAIMNTYEPSSNSTVSIGEYQTRSQLRTEGDSLVWLTSAGIYSFSIQSPHLMRLCAHDGRTLVKSGTFVLESGELHTCTDSTILEATDSRLFLFCHFDLGWSDQANMAVCFEFDSESGPKITVNVLDPPDGIDPWRVIWQVVPAVPCIRNQNNVSLPLQDLAGYSSDDFTLNGSRIDLGAVDLHGQWSGSLVLDWSDAETGMASIQQITTSAETAMGISVAFDWNQTLIDPQAVSTSISSYSTYWQVQRKAFWHNGLYWAFYDDGTAIVYQTSVDGITWSGKTSTGAGYIFQGEWTTEGFMDGTSFALSQRDNEVVIAWYAYYAESSLGFFAKTGQIQTDRIEWKSSLKVADVWWSNYPIRPPSAAITSDGGIWLLAQVRAVPVGPSHEEVTVFFSEDGSAFRKIKSVTDAEDEIQNPESAFVLLPLFNGDLAMVEVFSEVRWSYWLRNSMAWSSELRYASDATNDLQPWAGNSLSVSKEGEIVIVSCHPGCAQGLYMTKLKSDGSASGMWVADGGANNRYSPSVVTDVNGDTHVFFGEVQPGSENCRIGYVRQRGTEFTVPEYPFGSFATNGIEAVSAVEHPTNSLGLIWMETLNQPYAIKYGQMPLPFSTPAAKANPWSRDGLSPYGTYFSALGTSVSPGSGQLVAKQTLVSIPGRGIDLDLSMIHLTPRYFSGNSPWMFGKNPCVDMGATWQLNLPWIDDTYVYLEDGERYFMRFDGDPYSASGARFENHEGSDFVLIKRGQSNLGYFLMMPSGIVYKFDLITKRLSWICDSDGYSPDSIDIPGVNCINFEYDASNKLIETTDTIGRIVAFHYAQIDDSSHRIGQLDKVTRPDGTYLWFDYSGEGMTKVTEYDSTGNSILSTDFEVVPQTTSLLSAIVLPTGGQIRYVYGSSSVGTDWTAHFVTRIETKTSEVSTSQVTVIDYELADARVVYARLSQYDENGMLVGCTKYVFRGELRSSLMITQDSQQNDKSRVVQWYDGHGRSVQIDTYRIDSGHCSEPSSEYYAYDDWGNVIYTRDAIGHEKFYSFANTKKSDVSEGSGRLETIASGSLVMEGFDDRDLQGWILSQVGGSITIDSGYNPFGAPSLRLQKLNPNGVVISRLPFEPTSSKLTAEMSVMTSDSSPYVPDYLLLVGEGASKAHLCFYDFDNDDVKELKWYGPAYPGGLYEDWHVVLDNCGQNRWYSIRLDVSPMAGTYDIFIDGTLIIKEACLRGSVPSVISELYYQAADSGGTGADMRVDDLKVFMRGDLSVGGLDPGQIIDFCNLDGTVISRIKAALDGTATTHDYPINWTTPGYFIVRTADWTIEYCSPVIDVGGGGTFQYVPPTHLSPLQRSESGFGVSFKSASDDGLHQSAITGGSESWSFSSSRDEVAVSGSRYHTSPADGVVFSDSFEDGDQQGWTVCPDSNQVRIDWSEGRDQAPCLALSKYWDTQAAWVSQSFPSIDNRAIAELNVRISNDYTPSGLPPNYIILTSGGLSHVTLGFYDYKLQCFYQTQWHEILPSYEQGRWYRISIDIDVAGGKYDVLVDGELKYSEAETLQGLQHPVDGIYFQSHDGGTTRYGTSMWIDDVSVGTMTGDADKVLWYEDWSAPIGAGWTFDATGGDITYEYDSGPELRPSLLLPKSKLGIAAAWRPFDPVGDHAVVSYLVAVTDSTEASYMILTEDEVSKIHLAFIGSKLGAYYSDTPGGQEVWHWIKHGIGPNVWYSITIDAQISTGEYRVYLDGRLLGTTCCKLRGLGPWHLDGIRFQAGNYSTINLGMTVDNIWVVRTPDPSFSPVHDHNFWLPQEEVLDMIWAGSYLAQYVMLEDESIPNEIMLEYAPLTESGQPEWGHRAYWGDNLIVRGEDGTESRRAMGPLPKRTGAWTQLVVSSADVGLDLGQPIQGHGFVMYGGTAGWDLTASAGGNAGAIRVTGLQPGMKAKFIPDCFPCAEAIVPDLSTTATIDVYGICGMRAFPVSGYFEIFDADGTMLLKSQWFESIWGGDQYTFNDAAREAYVNNVDSQIHNRMTGSHELQDGDGSVAMRTYAQYDGDGNCIVVKRSHDTGWMILSATEYDAYGNAKMLADPVGAKTYVSYSDATNTYSDAYPVEVRSLGNYDYFEMDGSWTAFESGGSRWKLSAGEQYSSSRSFSPTRSLLLYFASPGSASDDGYASMSKQFQVSKFTSLTTKFMVTRYEHNGQPSEQMDSGMRLKLYNPAGAVIGSCYYWFASWEGTNNYKTANDSSISYLFNGPNNPPALNQWYTVTVHPFEDWEAFFDWSIVSKITVEYYVNAVDAAGDYLTIFFDDFGVDSVEKISYELATGLVISQTDPLGGLTSYDYDPLGRVTKVEYPSIGGIRDSIEFVYDDIANTVTLFDEKDRKTVRSFDGLGRLFGSYRYGLGMQAYSSEQWSYNWQDQVKTYTDPNSRQYSAEYDMFGRVVRGEDPLGNSQCIVYSDGLASYNGRDAWNRTLFDAYGRETQKSFYDVMNRLVSVWDRPTDPDIYEVVDYDYDEVGNLVSAGSIVGTTTMSYDDLNRHVRTDFPDGTFESTTYDSRGAPLEKHDRKGAVTTFVYESSGRASRVEYADGYVHYMYDAAGQTIRVANGVSTLTYSYDARGRVTGSTEIVDSKTLQLTLTYDTVGNILSITYPDTVQVTYVVDDYNRVSSVKWKNTNLVTYLYNVDGTIQAATTSTGYVTSYGYDELSRIESVNVQRSGSTLFQEAYTYDNVGNVQSIDSQTLQYDRGCRLTYWSGGGGTTYVLGDLGDRDRVIQNGVTTAYTYGPCNMLETAGAWSYDYDGNGNTVTRSKSGETWNFEYDGLNELTKAKKSGATVAEYYYDGTGARVKAKERSAPSFTYSAYVGHDPFYQVTGTAATDYIYVGSRIVANLTGAEGSPNSRTISYYYQDRMGSTRLITTGTSTVFEATYDPFGQIVSLTYPGNGSKVRFAGEIQDPIDGLGLYYLYQRYYDPSIGRFLSPDANLGSLGDPQTQNRYTYCVNSPTSFVDPAGAWIETLFDLGCVGWDIRELYDHPTWENAGWLIVDVLCLLAPGIPAIGGIARTLKGVDKAIDVGKGAEKAVDIERTFKKVGDVYEVAGTRGLNDLLNVIGDAEVRVRSTEDILVFRTYSPIDEAGKAIENRWLIHGGSWTYIDPRSMPKCDFLNLHGNWIQKNPANFIAIGRIRSGDEFMFRAALANKEVVPRLVGGGPDIVNKLCTIDILEWGIPY